MFDELKQNLERMPARDRMALLVLSVFLGLSLLWLLSWKLHQAAEKAEQSAKRDRETLEWMHAIAPQLKTGGGLAAGGGISVLDAVSGSAAAQGIVLQRFEPEGDRVRVWLENVEFAKAAAWMDGLSRQGVQAQEVHFEQADKGVSVRLLFGR